MRVREAVRTVRKTHAEDGAHHVVPSGHDTFHVQIAREERDNTIRHNLAVLDEDAPEIAHHCGVVPDLKPGADRDLVAATRDDLTNDRKRQARRNESLKSLKR